MHAQRVMRAALAWVMQPVAADQARLAHPVPMLQTQLEPAPDLKTPELC